MSFFHNFPHILGTHVVLVCYSHTHIYIYMNECPKPSMHNPHLTYHYRREPIWKYGMTMAWLPMRSPFTFPKSTVYWLVNLTVHMQWTMTKCHDIVRIPLSYIIVQCFGTTNVPTHKEHMLILNHHFTIISFGSHLLQEWRIKPQGCCVQGHAQ